MICKNCESKGPKLIEGLCTTCAYRAGLINPTDHPHITDWPFLLWCLEQEQIQAETAMAESDMIKSEGVTFLTPTKEIDFQAWMDKVDAAVWESVGVSVHDLPDCTFRDWHDDELTPEEAAARAIEYAF